MQERLTAVRGDPRRGPGRDVARRHRLADPGHPQRLRPDADRHRRAVGGHRHPPGQGARRRCEQYVESLTAAARPRQRQPAPPGRGVHRPVRGVHRRRTATSPPSPQAPAPAEAAAAPTSPRPCAAAGRRRVRRLRRPRPHPAPRDPAAGPRVRRLRPRALPAGLPLLPRRHASTSRRPTPGARPELARITAEMEAVAQQILPGATVKEAIDAARRRPGPPAARHRRAARPGCRSKADEAIAEPGRLALRHPGAGPHDRVPDRADRPRAASTTPARARTSAARAACGGPCPRASGVRHLARADHRLPRGRARPPPPGRPDRLPLGAAQPLAPARVAGSPATARAGRSTPSASWTTWATSTTRATGWACSTASRCVRPGWCSTSASTAASRPPPRWVGGELDLRQGMGSSCGARQHGRGLPALRAQPLPRLAGAGAVVQGRRADLAAAARRGPRPARATRSTSRRSTAVRWTSAASAWTRCGPPSWADAAPGSTTGSQACETSLVPSPSPPSLSSPPSRRWRGWRAGSTCPRRCC